MIVNVLLSHRIVHGATDELGFHAVQNRHYVTDVHATVLHLLGLDPRKLIVPGRKRLEIDFGTPMWDVMAWIGGHSDYQPLSQWKNMWIRPDPQWRGVP